MMMIVSKAWSLQQKKTHEFWKFPTLPFETSAMPASTKHKSSCANERGQRNMASLKTNANRMAERPMLRMRGSGAVIRFLCFIALLLGSIRTSDATIVATTDKTAFPPAGSGQLRHWSPLLGALEGDEAGLVRAIYDRGNSTFLWSSQGRPTQQARAVIGILVAADTFGLEPDDYAANLLTTNASQLNSESSQTQRSQFDILLTRATLRFISNVHYGRIDPRAGGFELAESRNDLDIVTTVASLASSLNVGEVMAAAEPHFYHYALLKSALRFYRLLAANSGITKLTPGGNRSLHLGDHYMGAQVLRELLVAERDLSETDAEATGQTLDAALVGALKHFQLRHGLTPDGTLGPSTFTALSTPMAQRVRQIELTLERWRWLPAFTVAPIIVNIPEFRLFAFNTTADRAASILQMPVIVGQTYPSKRTPIFVGALKYVVFRPYWDVPRSITLNEILPALRVHPDYMQRNNFEIVRGEGDDSPIVKPTPEAFAALAAGQVRVRQRPGDDNALGLIKFLFPNAHNVYMHSTPAHQLFLVSKRAFSHGCIRVSDPVALANYVLQKAPTPWDESRIVAAMHDDKSLRVELRESIPVFILYGTAMATEDGQVQFFDDIYGHDRKLEALLSLRPVNGLVAPR
jgi:murein L,D-transpeptidase YcbB/YkuD